MNNQKGPDAIISRPRMLRGSNNRARGKSNHIYIAHRGKGLSRSYSGGFGNPNSSPSVNAQD